VKNGETGLGHVLDQFPHQEISDHPPDPNIDPHARENGAPRPPINSSHFPDAFFEPADGH
jgi:hypothetical protein